MITMVFTVFYLNINPALVEEIDRQSKAYFIPPSTFYQVALVESGLDVDVQPNLNKNGTTDYGPFQVNEIQTLPHEKCYNLDIKTLKGNVECAARVINSHKHHQSKDKCWLARYHSKTTKYKKEYCRKLNLRKGAAQILERLHHE